MRYEIVLLPGDGIGPEVTAAAVEVLEATGLPLTFEEHGIGLESFRAHGTSVPPATLAACRGADAILFGATTTPPDVEGYRSAAVTLRQELDLYANLRPARSVPGIGHPGLDVTVVRENTEGLYSGVEERDGDRAVAHRILTKPACRRIVAFAFRHAERTGRDAVTAVHKANILRLTDGLFLEAAREVAAEHPAIELREHLVDAMAYKMVLDPTEVGILVTTNLFGDVLSDLAAGLLGSLGLAPSANIGDEHAMFEPVHGSAPDITGMGIANPAAAIRSAGLLLDHVGEEAWAERVLGAVDAALQDPAVRTPDLGGQGDTAGFTAAVIDGLDR